MNPNKYLAEAMHELRQVKWPTQKHAVRISIITGIFVIVSTVIIALVDFSLSRVLLLSNSHPNSEPAISTDNISATTENGTPINITTDGNTTNPITIVPASDSSPETTSEPSSTETPENSVSPQK